MANFICKNRLNVLQTFIDLTRTTIPHGREEVFAPLLQNYGAVRDAAGNWYIANRKGSEPLTTMFTCHLDTVCVGSVNDELRRVTHRSNGRYIYTDGKTNLGADDKAGMTILLSMLHAEVEGLYYFFVGEEVGGIGSSRIVSESPQTFTEIQRCVSFDRRGTSSIITHQAGGRCASDAFAGSLSDAFAKKGMFLNADSTGVFTDSANFKHIIPECTNISVGYANEHTCKEQQDMLYLESLCSTVTSIEWSSLKTSRRCTDDDDDYYFGYYQSQDYAENYKPFSRNKKKSSKVVFQSLDDIVFEYINFIDNSGMNLQQAWQWLNNNESSMEEELYIAIYEYISFLEEKWDFSKEQKE